MLQLASLDDLEKWQPPDLQTQKEAREATVRNLKPVAWRLLIKELSAFGHRDHEMDGRDLTSFLSAINHEVGMQERAGAYPAIAYEEFSSHCAPRTAPLIEALTFLLMTGRVAMIHDFEEARVNEKGERVTKGFRAQLAVY